MWFDNKIGDENVIISHTHEHKTTVAVTKAGAPKRGYCCCTVAVVVVYTVAARLSLKIRETVL